VLVLGCNPAEPPSRHSIPARHDNPTPKLRQAEPEYPRLVPVAGSATRARVHDLMMGTVDFVEPVELVRTLEEAERAIDRFARSTIPKTGRHRLASYSDHEVRSHDLQQLVVKTTKAMSTNPGGANPQILTASDTLTFPRVIAVWQFSKMHKVLTVYEANDNRGISFYIGSGEFSAADYGLKNLVETPPGKSLLDSATFLSDSMTIYPHIERYFVNAQEFRSATPPL